MIERDFDTCPPAPKVYERGAKAAGLPLGCDLQDPGLARPLSHRLFQREAEIKQDVTKCAKADEAAFALIGNEVDPKRLGRARSRDDSASLTWCVV